MTIHAPGTIPTSSALRPVNAAGARHMGTLRALGRAPAESSGGVRELRVSAELGRKIDARQPGAARQAATLMVSQLFFAPLLAEARKSPFGGAVGDGGRGEEVFGEQLDLRIADTVAAGLRGGLADQLESRLAQRQHAAAAGPTNIQAVQAIEPTRPREDAPPDAAR